MHSVGLDWYKTSHRPPVTGHIRNSCAELALHSQVAASANYHGVQWMLGFAQCVSSQYGITLTVL
jgi:hypothetical protein